MTVSSNNQPKPTISRRTVGHLSSEDMATLRHVLNTGTPDNTKRAYERDLVYLEAWCRVANGHDLPWPASQELVMKFLAHHLYDPDERERDSGHGMPKDIEDRLIDNGVRRTRGPHAPSTVRRRIATWSTLHVAQGLPNPMESPGLRRLLAKLIRASRHTPSHRSPNAVVLDILERLLDACDDGTLRGQRDRALLCVMWASGGRRRSEMGRIRREDIRREPDVLENPDDPHSPRLKAFSIGIRRTKTTAEADAARVWLVGPAAEELDLWLRASGVLSGSIFRRIRRLRGGAEEISPDDIGLSGDAVADVVKKRCRRAGLDPKAFSAHGLRSGFMTESLDQNVPLQEAMAQSLHRSVQQASRYYDAAAGRRSRSTRLMTRRRSATTP